MATYTVRVRVGVLLQLVCWLYITDVKGACDVCYRKLFLVAWSKYQLGPLCGFKSVRGLIDLAILSIVE